MTVWFVSRHPGALEWMQRHGPAFDRHVEHLALDDVQSGDWVVGTLPMQLAAQVCAKGAEYWHLVLHVPQPARGLELSAQQLHNLGATLQRFHVQPVGAGVLGGMAEAQRVPKRG